MHREKHRIHTHTHTRLGNLKQDRNFFFFLNYEVILRDVIKVSIEKGVNLENLTD